MNIPCDNTAGGITMSSNREYKSDVFSMLMEEPEHALDVYNALNGSDYHDPSKVSIMKLENSIRLSVHNDASFIIDDYLTLYEHQSSINPNMPLRFLIYITDLFQSVIKNRDLFSKSILKIPTPGFAVFYNGKKDYPEIEYLKLSDAYEHSVGEPELELVCKVYNINPGYNKALLDRCGVLREYSEFVECVRSYEGQCPLDEALDQAIDKCIKNHILEDFLKSRRSEVKRMMTLDYTFERRLQLAEEERAIELQKARKDERKAVEREMMGRIESSNQKAEAAEQKAEAVERKAEYKLISQIEHHIRKGRTVDQIAEDLLESTDRIRELMARIPQANP